MTYVILNGEDGLAAKISLTPLDCLSAMIAAACHDFKHDGFTNGWHAAKETDRFQMFGNEGT